MGSKRRNNPFWLPTTSNQTRSSCVYLENKTNKQKPCRFAGSRGKRLHFPWEEKGCQEGQEGFIVTGTSDTDLGRTPTCSRIYGRGALTNMGQNVNPAQFT